MESMLYENYTAPVYEPPKIFDFIGGLLEKPLDSRSATFTDLFSKDSTSSGAYLEGLFGLGTCFAALATFWFACLVILQCKGRDVGCASGHGFDGAPRDSEEDDEYYTDNHDIHELDLDETDEDEFLDEEERPNNIVARNATNSGGGYRPRSPRRRGRAADHHVKTLNALMDYESDIREASRRRGLDFHPDMMAIPNYGNDNDYDDAHCSCFSGHPYQIKTRRRRTRLAFLTSAILSICCSGLLLSKVHTPIREAADSMASLFVEGHGIVERVQTTLIVVEDAAAVADDVITTIPFDMVELCPAVPPEFFSSEIGVNPVDVVAFLEQEFETFLTTTALYVDEIQELTWQIENGLTEAGALVQENADRLWVLYVWVVSTIALTVLMMAGVVVAMREDARRFPNPEDLFQDDTWSEFILSWLVLPMLIVFTIIGWGLLIASSMSTAVASDVCTAGNPGSPEVTIRRALDNWEFTPISENTYNTIVAYTEGCRGENPIRQLIALEDLLDDNLDVMRARLNEANVVGYDTMKERCGEGNNIDIFFTGVGNLAGHLAKVRGSLGEVTTSLACPNINSLYSRSVHGVLCTDVAGASATGFVLLLVVSLANMILMSLRASWRHSR
mmetsp:Transcript_78033/g.117412  ORF Transcript_78033/g.117412 Transcript_78033/m.117412 type:complete len:618 (-) Transcript_78033:134-1987(-)